MRTLPIMSVLAAVALLAPSAAEEAGAPSLAERIKLEAHGFASFGYLRTYANNYLADDTREGTTEFQEAAVNAICRPFDRLRLGAQVFARDLGRYENGRAQLDWAYADYRFTDSFGLQAGRIKLALGLYNEDLDVDAARTPVFLPISVYPLRSRDFYLSTDGAKAYGLVQLGDGGELQYGLVLGNKPIDEQGGLGTYLGELGLGSPVTAIRMDWLASGFLHWITPWEGLAVRGSLADVHNLRVDGDSGLGEIVTEVDDYWSWVLSLLWESRTVTLATEYSRLDARNGASEIKAVGFRRPIADAYEGSYASITWHASPTVDLYLAGEAAFANLHDREGPRSLRAVAAARLALLDHWSLKAEFQHVDGELGIQAGDNPSGISDTWQIFALKTTVDF